MEITAKLNLLAEQMHLEPAEETPTQIPLNVINPPPTANGQPPAANCIQQANGPAKAILKTMLTSACERNCYYCPFRAGRNYRRATFKPQELAQTVSDMHRANLIDGLFLSSGIIQGGITTQDKLIATADILRHKHHFNGFLHLKIMPGAEKDQVERAMHLADRVSVNLEAPNDKRLPLLAPRKEFIPELLRPLQWANQIRRTKHIPRPDRPTRHLPKWQRTWASTVTQFVVGAVGESDLELLTTANYLYNQLHLRRTYFSAFFPIHDTPLENTPAENPVRQHRLYQSSFLLRDYGFDLEDMPFDPAGKLPLNADPKLAWAEQNLRHTPLDLNRATRTQLLRVPGIGPKGADTLLKARRQTKLNDLNQLRKLGLITTRLAPFILLNGHRPPQQLKLF